MADRPPAPRPASPPPPPAVVDLRPLTTSELIDRGFALYRAHFTGFLLLALLCQVVPLAMSQALIAAIKLMPSENGLMDRPPTDLTRMAVLMAATLIGLVVTFGFEVVITSYLSQAYLGRTPAIKAGLRTLMSRLGGAVGTSLLRIVLVGATLVFPLLAGAAIFFYFQLRPPQGLGSLLLLFAGSVVLLVASVAPALIVFVRLMVTVPVVALEGVFGWKAMKRSFSLVRFDPGLGILYWGEMRLSFLLLPLFVIEILVFSLTSLPVTLQQINEFMRHGGGGQIVAPSESLVIFSQVLTFLALSLLLPLYSIATTLFYYDVRIRREGFDLEFMAGQLEPRK